MTMTFAENLAQSLKPIADQFASLNFPEPIVHWGHPAMMGIVIAFMGSYTAISGWKGRLADNPEDSGKNRTEHRKVAPLMTVFLITGYTGGVLSLVMQNKPILESPHFLTGTAVVALLLLNGSIASLGFKGEAVTLRKAHAYIGSGLMALLVVHAAFGLKLGLSL